MAERLPNGKRRASSRFVADYFDVERLRKREGIDQRLHDFAARRPWILRQMDPGPRPPSSETPESNSSSSAPVGDSMDQALERLHTRVESVKGQRRPLPPDTLRAIGESVELLDEYERMKRRVQSMGEELDAME